LTDFEIHKVLGRGAFGKVMLITRKADGGKTPLALKAIRKHAVVEQNMMDCIKEEYKIWKKVNHPNLCPLIDSFTTEGRVFFVAPFYQGGELYTHL
jgi:serum/glucocorticoid-regulated kinase 2